jgi:uncharacterized protein
MGTILEASRRQGTRTFARRVALRIALAGAIAAVAAGSAFAAGPARGAGAQTATESPAGVTVTGYGEASAPPESVDLQILVTRGDIYGGPPPRPRRGEAPGVEERALAAPIVKALVAAGVAESAITVQVSPAPVEAAFGPGGPAVARLDVAVKQTDLAGLTDLIGAAGVAAADQDLVIGQVGARFAVADCAALERQARQAAITDARARAQIQADLLGVKLGDVTGSTDLPIDSLTDINYFGVAVEANGCAPPRPAVNAAPGLVVTFPSFDTTEEPAVEVYARVSLTFAIAV